MGARRLVKNDGSINLSMGEAMRVVAKVRSFVKANSENGE